MTTDSGRVGSIAMAASDGQPGFGYLQTVKIDWLAQGFHGK
jgi:hypothetical protein